MRGEGGYCTNRMNSTVTAYHLNLPTAQCGCGKCSYLDIIYHRCNMPRIGMNFPFIDIREMSDTEKHILKSRLRGEAQIIFNEFDILFDDFKTWLQKQGTTLQQYQSVLQNITGFEEMSENGSKLLEDRKKDIREAQDFETLDDIIHDYVNWFSFSLLSTIVDRVCRKNDRSPDDFREKEMIYKTKLQCFCQRCIYECPMPSILPPSNKFSKYLCLKVHMCERYIKVKADMIMTFQLDLSKALNLSNHTLCLKSVLDGCVEVLFSIPTSIHSELFPLQRNMLHKLIPLGVIKICSDGYVLEWDKTLQCFHQVHDQVIYLSI